MRDFFNAKTNDLTIGQSLIAAAIITVVSALPLVGVIIAEKLS